jgi:GT2 family glycosyltransferase
MAAKLTIQVVGWNSAAELPETLAALSTIPRGEAEIRYLDNASRDDSVALVKRYLPQADIVELSRNTGFGGAHNIGLHMCRTPFVVVLNPDVVLNWAGVRDLMRVFDDPTVGAAQGKLYRTDGRMLDSAGIIKTSALNGSERGAFEEDRGQYNTEANLLAVTGACGLYRLAALNRVADESGEFFDEDFFAYKEDVDLGWRLNRAGWRVVYRPILMGQHRRVLGRRGFMNWGLTPRSVIERLRSERTRYSLRNWVWMIAKNASLREEMRAEIFIDARLFFFFAVSLVYWPLVPVWTEIFRGLPLMAAKRELR